MKPLTHYLYRAYWIAFIAAWVAVIVWNFKQGMNY